MVEQILFFVLGFLAASLGALAFLRAVWSRAVRLTTLRVVSRLPVSPAMIAADRDRLRAAHAIDIRRLERRIDQLMTARPASEAISVQDKAAIRRLSAELSESRARLGDMEVARRATVQQATRPASSPLRETIWAGSRRALDLVRAGVERLPQRRETPEADPAKVAALEAEVHSLLAIVGNLETELAQRAEIAVEPAQTTAQTTAPAIAPPPAAAAALEPPRPVSTQDDENRELLTTLAEHNVDLEQRLAIEQENLAGARHQANMLQAELAGREQALAEERKREAELAGALEEAKAREAQQAAEIERLGAEREATAAELASMLEMLRAERAGFEVNIEGARLERAKLQQHIAALEREIADRQAEQEENRYLRQRLEALADDIVRRANEAVVQEGPAGDPGAPSLAPVETGGAELEPAVAEAQKVPRRATS